MEPTSIVITPDNQISESGRFVNSFHSLATVENVFASLENKEATNDTLNVVLDNMRKTSVNDVLVNVFDLNTRAKYATYNLVESLNYSVDYTAMIEANTATFDTAIGMGMAIKALEQLRLTNRSNTNSTNPKLSEADFTQLFHGAYSPITGKLLVKGIYAQYRDELEKIINVLFPVKYPDGAIVNPDGTVTLPVVEKPVIRGIRPW